jgi:anti-sigma factor RsiW
MDCSAYREAIAERVDDTLDDSRRAALDRHLERCPACSALVSDLARIKTRASSLGPIEPPPSIRARLTAQVEAARAGERRASRRMRLVALAASLVLAAGVGTLLLRNWSSGTAPQAVTDESRERTEDTTGLVQSIEEELRLAAEHYERAITGLEQAASADQQSLDPVIAATLQKNLGVIDQAIEESRAALKSQPTSQPARESLFDAFRNKVALLQDTVALINEMRKGDDAGTARMVGELTK